MTNKSDHSVNDKHTLTSHHETVLKMLGRAFARVSHLFGYSAREVGRAFKEGYLEYLLEKSPRAKVVELALQSGLDRRQISEYLKTNTVNSWHKPTRLDLILSHLKWISEKHSVDGYIPLYGNGFTLEATCKQFATGNYTTAAVLQELLRRQAVKLRGEKLELINWAVLSDQEDRDFAKVAAWSIEMLSRTLAKNKHTKLPAMRNFHRFLYSTQIPNYRVNEVHNEVVSKLSQYYHELTALLEEAESDVRPGTFPVYGISFFEFGRESLAELD